MDHNKLRALVFEKSGIKIDEQDPVFALVALNEAVLTELLRTHQATMNETGDKLKSQTRYLMEAGERYRKLHMGEMPSPQNQASYESWASENAPPANPGTSATGVSRGGDTRLLLTVAATALLSASLVLGGYWMLNRTPPPAAAPVAAVQAPPLQLTPTQTEMIKVGEKFSRIMLNLDEKTRAAIEAEMEKP